MGVFARFRRRKETAEASPQEEAVVTSADESAEGAEKPAEASDAAASVDSAETAETGPEAASADGGVEIPKQQSAEEAADNEAGESARK
ncbi:hypothetical protein [Streptomyces gobitricini]|uniref:Gliding motility protein n=1 Tax=Streptomyces gobitricini TaxID=68211 RepID=A0ABN3LNS6_9ACTN